MDGPSTSQTDYLIDAILRLTARLIATIATVDGELADLSMIGQQLRHYTARELGPPRNRIALVASAFGVSETSIYSWRRKALRPPRLRHTDRDWLLDFLREQTREGQPMRRETLEKHFVTMASGQTQAKEGEELATSTVIQIYQRFEAALWLLRKADLVFATSSEDPLYFAPTSSTALDTLAGLVWLEIFERSSITPIAFDELVIATALSTEELKACLELLVEQRRVERVGTSYRSAECYFPIEDSDDGHSLEVAALDHLRVVIDTLIDRFEHRSVTTGRSSDEQRKARELLRSLYDAKSGMVSWRFDMWTDHPHLEAVLALGEKLVELGHRMSIENRMVEGQPTAERVVYVGMHTRALDDGKEDDET